VAKKKKTYRIGDACSQVDIQPYVLRYWETEFPPLSPDKSQSGQRHYTEDDLQVIRRIKELLYDEGYTIAGAKKKLEAELDSGGPQVAKASAAKESESETSAASTEAAPEKSDKAAAKKKAASKGRRRKSSATKVAKKGAKRSAKSSASNEDPSGELSALRAGVEKVLDQARSLLQELES
jgi:DNA-binding transcriptional MerR regulator